MGKNYTVKIDFLAGTNIDKIALAVEKATKRATKASAAMNKSLKDNEQAFNSLNRAATKATKVVGAAFVAGMAASILAGSKFEESLQELSAITGLQGEALRSFGDDALDMSKKMGLGATAYLDGVKLIASAKPELLTQPELLKEITDQALILSKAGKLSLQTAADSLTTAMNQFQLGAGDANRAINVLAAGSKMGSSFINDTSQAIRNAGVSARLAGLSFEETNAAIQILAAGGIRGSEAGTQLQAVFLAMAAQSDDFNPKIVGVTKALENFNAAGLDSVKMEEVFQRRGLKAAAILIEQKDAFANMIQSVTGTNIAYEQAGINMQAFNEKAKRLGSTIQAVLIKAFLKMAPTLTKIVDRMILMFDYLGNNLGVIKKVAIGVGVATAAMWAFILPTKILQGLNFAKTLLGLTKAMGLFNVAVLTNPITWIVVAIAAAIGALTYVVYKYWDILKPAFIDVWAQAQEAFGPALESLRAIFGTMFGESKPFLTWLANMIGTVLVSAIFGFMEVLKLAIKWLHFIYTPIRWVLEKIQDLIDKRKELGDLAENEVKDGDFNIRRETTAVVPGGANTQSLDVNMKIDSEGRPSIENVSSDGKVSFDADLGNMVPVFGG